MKNDKHSWRDDFPQREEVEDCRGKSRTFVITCNEMGLGFTLRAQEQGVDQEYEFAAYSETSHEGWSFDLHIRDSLE